LVKLPTLSELLPVPLGDLVAIFGPFFGLKTRYHKDTQRKEHIDNINILIAMATRHQHSRSVIKVWYRAAQPAKPTFWLGSLFRQKV
jgi:hypothetical protein